MLFDGLSNISLVIINYFVLGVLFRKYFVSNTSIISYFTAVRSILVCTIILFQWELLTMVTNQ